MSNQALDLTTDYTWEITGKGAIFPRRQHITESFVAEWSLIVVKKGDNDETLWERAVSFSVVNNEEAINSDVELYDVYDSEGWLHSDCYERINAFDFLQAEDLFSNDRVIILADSELLEFTKNERIDVLQIIDYIFSRALIIVSCSDCEGKVAKELSAVMEAMPSLKTDNEKVVWFYHNGDRQWIERSQDNKN